MSIRHLDFLFRPRSIAVIGASGRPNSVGGVVMRNLLRGGFNGPVMPVNPHRQSVAGVLACATIAELPLVPDLAVICTPAPTVPDLIEQLGTRGTRAAIVISAGLSPSGADEGPRFDRLALAAAGRHRLRLLGPNCLGLLVPSIGLNASFAHVESPAGDLAFVSQSGAICTAVLDWAQTRRIGFSHFVSLGDSIDVDAGDVLDYLGVDPATRAILLYLESVGPARKFLSAARAAARLKPVIAIKAGRGREGVRAAASHTGALAGDDDVHTAAFERAGMLRVDRLDELFDTAETLTRMPKQRSDELLVVTNGGGLGVLAADHAAARGCRLATLDAATIAALDAVLPPNWSRGNPIDIIGDASGERYEHALRILANSHASAALLIVHAPTALASSEVAARAIVRSIRAHGAHRTVLTSWVGGTSAERARRLFHGAGIATFDTPEDAIGAFAQMTRHARAQEALLETPPALPDGFTPDRAAARAVISAALANGRTALTEPEAKAVLAAYGIPIVPTRIATSCDEVAAVATAVGFPVAVKIQSPQLSHKSDIGGVVLDLRDAAAAVAAAQAMAERLREQVPGAELHGFIVQPMARLKGAYELIAGAATDPVFGPVVLFGQGGTAVELIADRAVTLPPLNLQLAHRLIERTRIARLLAGYRDRPAVDLAALQLALIQVAQIVTDLPEVREFDINPLLAHPGGVLALDARMQIAPAAVADRLAIHPYPVDLTESVELPDGARLLLRPIRPEDEPAHREFLDKIRPEDIRFRFFNLVRRMSHSQLARYTQIDYDREMAFIALAADADGTQQTVGVVRAISDPDRQIAEFAVLVRSDWKGRGLGHALLDRLIRYLRDRGTREVVGQVLPDNQPMIELAQRLGFSLRTIQAEGVIEARLSLAGS
jgi:acetyltransferase